MDQVKVGKLIQELRKKHLFTQKELANQLGVSDKTISKWETGNGMPDLCFLKPLSDILGITVNELLCGEFIVDEEIKNKTNQIVLHTIQYSNKKIKKNKCGTYLIAVGSSLLFVSLLFSFSGGMKALFAIFALFTIAIGIYQMQSRYQLLKSILFFVIAMLLLLLMDYNNVKNNYHDPIFAYRIDTMSSVVTYHTLLYNVNKCNPNTTNEYYEIHFSKRKKVCNNPFVSNKSDITKLIHYQNKYVGNNSNVGNLYSNLPLAQYGYTYEINSNSFEIIIHYQNSEPYINEDNHNDLFVKKSLIYNAISSFVLINNLEHIMYDFYGIEYQIQKRDVIEKYDGFSKILKNDKIDVDVFKKYVDEKIQDDGFVSDMFERLFVRP